MVWAFSLAHRPGVIQGAILSMNSRVLVLNATYEPLNVVSVRRAVVLLLKEKAELVEAAEAKLRAEHIEVAVPLVIRLVTYVKVPRRFNLPVSRRTVLSRDNYTCQYCGDQPGADELTIDHVLPRSRGGGHAWGNVVTACGPCNHRKGDCTPAEAGMPLRRKPYRPRYIAVALLGHAESREVWEKYLAYGS